MGRCDFCGGHAPVVAVHYRQNTGMVLMRQTREWPGDACRECSRQLFWMATIHTFFLGWWGTISFIVTPFFIAGNIFSFVKTLRLPTAAVVHREALHGQEDYARNLLATKDRDTVVDVLVRSTGASPHEVQIFLDKLG